MSSASETFRLIAIRTGDKLTDSERSWLDPKSFTRKDNFNYIKGLRPLTDYVLFNCFKLSKKNNELVYKEELDSKRLYQLKKNKDVNVEISAIVGKNGSGKSTLLEIIYLAIHNLAVAKSILFDEDRNRIDIPQNYLRCELIFQIEYSKFISIQFKNDDSENKCVVWESTSSDNKHFKFDKEINLHDFKLENFFYNIVVNYSVYGLNAKRIGNWINYLFHKNDSYQAPIVINPMRTNGNFDINKEESLTRTRLIANTAIKQQKSNVRNQVTEKQFLDTLFFQLDLGKISHLEFTDRHNGKLGEIKTRSIEELIEKSKLPNASSITKLALKLILKNESNYQNVIHYLHVEKYIVKKLYKIAFTYARYNSFLNLNGYDSPVIFESLLDPKKLNSFLIQLGKDKSHVTTKLRQALNYLANNPLRNHESFGWIETNTTGSTITMPIKIFNERITGFSEAIINCIPPSLFKVFINIKNLNNDESSELEQLSSGELQLINSVQSSLYHLNNLDSYVNLKNDIDKIKYRNVLLIFDEVELYFHPEFQRKMVNYLLEEIDTLNLKLAKNIHILFVTHSPFILSDIPHGRLLKLVDGTPVIDNSPTFAANIYEMLKSSFFLESGTGVYSKKVINEILDELNEILLLKKHPRKNAQKIKSKTDSLVVSNKLNIIRQIGDDIIRKKLLEMYFLASKPKKSKQELIKDEISRLQNELKNIQ